MTATLDFVAILQGCVLLAIGGTGRLVWAAWSDLSTHLSKVDSRVTSLERGHEDHVVRDDQRLGMLERKVFNGHAHERA